MSVAAYLEAKAARRSQPFARVIDVTVLLVCLVAALAKLFALAEMWRLPASVVATALLISAVGTVLCAWLAWRSETGFALVVAIFFVIFASVWNDEWASHYSKAEKPLVFSTSGASVRAAEFWVNGVSLGKTPVHITKEELLCRVPRWDKPPPDFDQEVEVPVLSPDWEQAFQARYKRWFAWDFLGKGNGTWYVQAKYAGETGVATGNGVGSGPSISEEFLFPKRQQRLQLLLNRARLADYMVNDEWFRALETFDEDGWIALRKAGQTEPGMGNLLSKWATRNYQLDKVQNSSDAWTALERVRSEADRRQRYFTTSVAGRAVELLAKKLDPTQLLGRGERMIARTTSASFGIWPFVGYTQFGIDTQGERWSFRGSLPLGRGDQGMFYGTGNGVGSILSPGDLVIVHALRQMWQLGRGHELFQSQIAPDLLAYHYDDTMTLPLAIAANIGGPEVDQFLFAQPWQRHVTFADSGMGVFEEGSHEINRWLYLLAQLNDAFGRQFRRDHAEEVMAMASDLLHPTMQWEQHLDFLFQDQDLAWKFWPRFVEASQKATANDILVLQMQYSYLGKINALPSAYIAAWKQTKPTYNAAGQGVGELRSEMPPFRGRYIAATLLDFVKNDPHATDQMSEGGSRNALIHWLTAIADPEEHLMSEARDDLKRNPHINGEVPPKDWQFHIMALWLSGPGGFSPVVSMLATAPEPELRRLSLHAIRGVPIASNRQLLQKLLSDPDAKTRNDARALDQEVKALAARPLSELTSEGK